MAGFDVTRLELIAKKYLAQADGDRRTAAQLLRRRVDSNVALKLGIMELLVEPATWDLMRQASTVPDADTNTEPVEDDELKTSVADIASVRTRFERHISKMNVLPFPGASRKHELLSGFEDLKDRVTTTLGEDGKLFHALSVAVQTKRRADIQHVLAVYESQPYAVLDRIWSTE